MKQQHNYILQLSQENYLLKLKCNELQNEIQELKKKQEELYRNHANSILILQSRNLSFNQMPIFHISRNRSFSLNDSN